MSTNPNPTPQPLPPLDDPALAVPRPKGRVGRRLIAWLVFLAIVGTAGYFAYEYWRGSQPHFAAASFLRIQGIGVEWHPEDGGYTAVDFSRNSGIFSDQTKGTLKHLYALHHVRVLNLSDNYRILDKDLARLAGLTELEELRLGRTSEWGEHYTDDGLAQLRTLTRLKHLDVRYSDLTDDGLALLDNFPRLEHLDLSQTKITDAGLDRLKSVPRLKILYLDRDAVTDAGLARLAAALPDLEELYLNGTRITDAGLRHLKGLARLKLLQAEKTRITEAGAAELTGGRTDLEIVYENPALLRP